jgi:hypothetical protein
VTAAADVLSDVLSSQRGSLYALVPQGKALFAEFALQAEPEAGAGLAIVGYPRGAAAQALVELANQRDGSDNISIQLIRIRGVERVGMYRGRPYRLR